MFILGSLESAWWISY